MNEYPLISNAEWQQISFALEEHHVVFYQLWEMGKPIFNEEIDTAAVSFDENGSFVYFHFNPYFWQRINFKHKLFVICHEALHVILNHGLRIKNVSNLNRIAVNAALDIVVNHTLIRNFNFKKAELDDWENYCWVETVFKDKDPLPADNETYEYYYNLFDKFYGDGFCDSFQIVDDHSFLNNEQGEKAIQKLNEIMSEEEKSSLHDVISKNFFEKKNSEAGKGTGKWTFIAKPAKKIKRKKKWESVIKKWSLKFTSDSEKEIEQWSRLNRRLVFLSKNMFLPSDAEQDDYVKQKNRIQVWFYLDTSGSCYSLKDRFFDAADSLCKKRFDVRLFCFDTSVKETSLSSRKIYGGGGTSYKIIEAQIQKEIKTKKTPYPEAIFVLTDGFGDKIQPEKPENWSWFLTPHGFQEFIPPNSFTYKLEDYE